MPDAHPTQTPPKAQKATAGKAFAAPQTPPLVNIGTLRPLLPDPDAQRRRSYRYWLQSRLKKMLYTHGVESRALGACAYAPVPAIRAKMITGLDGRPEYRPYPTGMPGHIEVHRTADRGHYYGVAHCGSALTCPVCGPAIAAKRGQEARDIAAHMIAAGYQYLFLTLTASHDKNTILKDFRSNFNNSKDYMRAQRQYKNFCKEEGLQHYITAVEVTDDHPDSKTKSGWHYHNHTVLFFKRDKDFSQQEVDKIQSKMTELWKKSLQKYGLHCDDTHGAHIAPLQERAKNHLGKMADVEKIAEYITKSIGYELTAGAMKTQRRKDDAEKERRISSWKLLEIAIKSNNYKLQKRYIEYIDGIKGIALLRTSKGLKELCGIKDVSDADLMRGEKGQEEIYIFSRSDDWKKVVQQSGQGKILDIVDYGGHTKDVSDAVQMARQGIDIATGEVYTDEVPDMPGVPIADYTPAIAYPRYIRAALAPTGRDARPVPPHRARAG